MRSGRWPSSVTSSRGVYEAPALQQDVAPTLAEARARLDSGTAYDAVLTDLHLPDGHGLDLILEIRARDLATAVVALTSQGDESVVLAALKAGPATNTSGL